MMKKISQIFSNASIEDKISLIIMSTCAIMLFCAFGIFALYSSKQMEEEKTRELQLLHKLVSADSYNMLVYRDYDAAVSKLDLLGLNNTVSMACLYDFDGVKFATYIRYRGANNCPEVSELKYGGNKGNNIIYNYNDIFLNNEKLGSLYIETGYSQIDSSFIQLLKSLFFASLIALIVAYLICVWLLKIVSRPVRSLVNTAKIVSENHNYSVRVTRTTNDDFGLLVDSFNYMLEQIHNRDKAIVEAYEGLELRVAERTKELDEARSLAESANRAKTSFLTNMSHELRTPMHAILSYSEFGREEIKTASREELDVYFTRINHSGERLLNLLNNLLDLSKLEAGKVIFDIKKININKVVKLALHELQSLVERKKIKIKIIDSGFEPIIECDAVKLLQVIYNLFSNAIKFSLDGGEITILYEQTTIALPKGGYIERIMVSVKDEGPGIPAGELEAVFDKFIQSTKTLTGAGGTGLGLAISKEIIEAHHGKIWCENNNGHGAVFSFILPVKYEYNK